MDAEAKRLQRKQEIEEKKRRLQEMRMRKKVASARVSLKAGAEVKEPAKPAARAPVKTVDKLLETIESSAQKEATAPPAPEVELVAKTDLCSVTVEPQPIMRYARAVMTDVSAKELRHQAADAGGEDSLVGGVHAAAAVPGMSAPAAEVRHAEEEAAAAEEEEEIVIHEIPDGEREEVLESRTFHQFLDQTIVPLERILRVNKQYDVLVDYARDLEQLGEAEGKGVDGRTGELKFAMEFYKESFSRYRSVTGVQFHPKQADLVLASYSEATAGSQDSNGLVLLWSLQNTLDRPEFEFRCSSQVCAAAFNPFDAPIVVGGTYCGQIVVWDMRAKHYPVLQSPLSNVGHTHPVFSLQIIGSQHANNLVSASTDGRMCTWRLDDLRQPVDVHDLAATAANAASSAPSTPIAVTCLEFGGADTNAFLAGSEENVIYRTFRHGSKKGEFTRFEGHAGPITGLSAHPREGPVDLSDYVLTSSMDWTVRLWNIKGEEGSRLLHTFENSEDYIADVKWSPVHPTVFATADGEGHVTLWDLAQDTELPVCEETVSKGALNRLAWSPNGSHLAVGTTASDDQGGTLRIYNASNWASPGATQWAQAQTSFLAL